MRLSDFHFGLGGVRLDKGFYGVGTLHNDDTLYLKNRKFAPTPTSDIISYRMRRSKKLIIQGTDNGCGGVTVQKNQNKRKNNLL